MQKDKCKKCNKNYTTLVDGVCFYCNPEKWMAHFNKLAGKNK